MNDQPSSFNSTRPGINDAFAETLLRTVLYCMPYNSARYMRMLTGMTDEAFRCQLLTELVE